MTYSLFQSKWIVKEDTDGSFICTDGVEVHKFKTRLFALQMKKFCDGIEPPQYYSLNLSSSHELKTLTTTNIIFCNIKIADIEKNEIKKIYLKNILYLIIAKSNIGLFFRKLWSGQNAK